MASVLLVEDDPTLLATTSYRLRQEGYDVTGVPDGEAALLRAAAISPDAVVLDVMLPKLDGFEVCRRLRERSSVPILMLTARSDEVDRIVGLEIGADDYLTKPFSQRELVARVKALLRRRELLRAEMHAEGTHREPRELVAGDLRIDLSGRHVWRGPTEVLLTRREFDLLAYLVCNRGQVLSAEALLKHVWGYDYAVDTRTVPVHIRALRQKLEIDPARPRRVETVRGVGYRFAE